MIFLYIFAVQLMAQLRMMVWQLCVSDYTIPCNQFTAYVASKYLLVMLSLEFIKRKLQIPVPITVVHYKERYRPFSDICSDSKIVPFAAQTGIAATHRRLPLRFICLRCY